MFGKIILYRKKFLLFFKYLKDNFENSHLEQVSRKRTYPKSNSGFEDVSKSIPFPIIIFPYLSQWVEPGRAKQPK